MILTLTGGAFVPWSPNRNRRSRCGSRQQPWWLKSTWCNTSALAPFTSPSSVGTLGSSKQLQYGAIYSATANAANAAPIRRRSEGDRPQRSSTGLLQQLPKTTARQLLYLLTAMLFSVCKSPSTELMLFRFHWSSYVTNDVFTQNTGSVAFLKNRTARRKCIRLLRTEMISRRSIRKTF